MSLARIRKVVLVAGLVMIAAAAGGELLLRAVPELGPSHAQTRIAAVFTSNGSVWSLPDDELGFVGKPGLSHEIDTIDFSYVLERDELGFANPSPRPAKADVVFLGDSLITGAGVGLQGQLTTLVERDLGMAVMNFGLPGASPEHELRIFRRFGARFEPRIVVACLYVASDVDNAKAFDAWQRAGRAWNYEEFRTSRYREVRDEIVAAQTSASNGTAVVPDADLAASVRAALRGAVSASALGREILYALTPLRKGLLHHVEWRDGTEVFLSTRFQQRLAQGIGSDYPGIERVFFDPLVELRRTVESAGAAFVVVLIPSKEEIFTTPRNDDPLRLVEEVRRELEQRDLPVLDLYPVIAEAARSTAPFYPHDIHLNAAGNEAAARAIADWIRTQVVARAP